VGELGVVGTAAAIANAVFHPTGVRVRDLPIRLDKVFRKTATSRTTSNPRLQGEPLDCDLLIVEHT
jgi:hypothetical protein